MITKERMGLEFGRGNNPRCPPFLVGGLMVMCLFLLCNWWSLSSENFELLRAKEDLAEQLRVNGEELNKCAHQKLTLEERVKDFQNRVNQERVKYDQVKVMEQENNEKYQQEKDELSKKVSVVEAELERCHTEKESLKSLGESKDKTLETLRSDKKALESDLEQKKSKIKELEDKLNDINFIKDEPDKGKGSIVYVMNDKIKNKENANKADKETQVENNPPIEGGNHDSANLADENNAQEVRNDADPGLLPLDPGQEMKDDRETLMRGTSP